MGKGRPVYQSDLAITLPLPFLCILNNIRLRLPPGFVLWNLKYSENVTWYSNIKHATASYLRYFCCVGVPRCLRDLRLNSVPFWDCFVFCVGVTWMKVILLFSCHWFAHIGTELVPILNLTAYRFAILLQRSDRSVRIARLVFSEKVNDSRGAEYHRASYNRLAAHA